MSYYNLKKVILFLSLSVICTNWVRPDILDAKIYYEFSDYDNCLIELKKILKLNIISVDALRLYQDVMLKQDQYPALLKEFEERVKRNPEDYLSNYLYGRVLVKDLYSSDLAERYIKRAIELNPKFPWNYMPLALISYDNNDIAKSINILEECIRKCGDFIPSYLMIVDFYQKLYGMEKAIQILIKYLDRVPSDLDLSLKLANFYCRKNEIKKADKLIKKIKKNYKNDYRYHRVIFAWAMCTDSNKIKKKSLEFYWDNYPNAALILSVYSNLFDIYKSESIDKALKFTRDAINYKTKRIKVMSRAYGNLIEYHKNRDPDEFIEIGKEVLNSNLSNPNIFIQLGKLILESGNAELALLLFQKANHCCEWNNLKKNVVSGTLIRIEDRNNLRSSYLNTSYLYLGKAHYAIGAYRKALEYYSQIADPDSNFAEEVCTDMAMCYIFLNDHREAFRIALNSYQKFSSPKILELLKEIYIDKYGSLDGFVDYLSNASNLQSYYENIKNIGFFSDYKGKILIFTLQRSSCYACNEIIEVLAKLENVFENNEEIVFINLYKMNEPKLNLKSIKVDKDIYTRVMKEFNVLGVPYTLIIDKDGNIRFRMTGFRNDVNIFADIKARIEILSR